VSAHAAASERPPLPDFTVADRLMPVDPTPERQTHWSNGAVTLTDVVYSATTGFRPLHLDQSRAVKSKSTPPWYWSGYVAMTTRSRRNSRTISSRRRRSHTASALTDAVLANPVRAGSADSTAPQRLS
jgi:hypothetical protein